MKKLTYYSVLIILFLMSSCYEDKGNYTYDDSISDINVKLDKLYGVKKEDKKMAYTITPEIKTADGDMSYLEYVWVVNTHNPTYFENDTISTAASVTLEIDPEADDFAYSYYLRLYIHNKKTGTDIMVPTQVEITKPYSYSWIVLHEVENHAELGAVEYVGESMWVTPDAYTKERGNSMSGMPLTLSVRQKANSVGGMASWGYQAMSELYMNTTNPEESGLLNQTNHFELMAKYKDLFSPVQIDNVELNDIKGGGSDGGLVIATRGSVFRNMNKSAFFFQMNPGNAFVGDYYIDKLAVGPHTALGYDKVGHRFVHIALQTKTGNWNGYAPSGEYHAGDFLELEREEGNAADPCKIDGNEDIIAFFNGYHYESTGFAIWQKYSAYAYGLAPGNRSHVYVFRYYALTNAGNANMPGYYEFITPEGITKDTPMTSGYEYNNIIFYAVNNKVYKLDVSTGQSTLIYQHEDVGARITCLKMAVEAYQAFGGNDDTGTEIYGHPYTRCLGAGINLSGEKKGEFVVLQLNTAGKVDENKKYPSIQVHEGFGKIKDIAFI